jgi:hypothetical protein
MSIEMDFSQILQMKVPSPAFSSPREEIEASPSVESLGPTGQRQPHSSSKLFNLEPTLSKRAGSLSEDENDVRLKTQSK